MNWSGQSYYIQVFLIILITETTSVTLLYSGLLRFILHHLLEKSKNGKEENTEVEEKGRKANYRKVPIPTPNVHSPPAASTVRTYSTIAAHLIGPVLTWSLIMHTLNLTKYEKQELLVTYQNTKNIFQLTKPLNKLNTPK